MDIVAQLKVERDKLARQLKALDAAIRALSAMNGSRGGSIGRPRPRISAAGRTRIAAAARARWAKLRAESRGQPGRATRRQRTMSVAARRKIAASQRARWAKIRGGKK